MNRDLQELPKFDDRWSYVYFERGNVCEHRKSIAYFYSEKMVPIPIESINLIMLGPGTTITHEAIKRTAEARCLIAWVGESGVRFYSAGYAGTYSSRNLLRQVRQYADEKLRMDTILRMYRIRFDEPIPNDITIEKLRGKEGIRVRKAYANASREFGVKWYGRRYNQKDWRGGDPVNRALSAANATLYGIIHAAILSAGFSPAIGFIHTGKQLSLVYDIADLYKLDISVPLAFKVASEKETNIEREVRIQLRDKFRETRLLKRIIPDIKEVLFGNSYSGEGADEPEGRDVAISY